MNIVMVNYKFDKSTSCWAVLTEHDRKIQVKVYYYLHRYCSNRMFWGTVRALRQNKVYFDINIATVGNR